MSKVLMIGGIKNSLKFLVGAIIILFVIAPYLHIFMESQDTNKVFGFKNMRSFMYVIGLPLSLFLCSSLLLMAAQYIKEKQIKIFFTIVAFLFFWSSFFQFIWIFWDRQDLPRVYYYSSLIILSLGVSLLYHKLFVWRRDITLKLQKVVDSLSRFSFITAKRHINPRSKEQYNKDLLQTLKEGMK